MYRLGLVLEAVFVSNSIGNFWSINGQANLPSPEQAPYPLSRVSGENVNTMGPRGSEPPSEEGKKAADGPAAQQIRRRLRSLAIRGVTDSRGNQILSG